MNLENDTTRYLNYPEVQCKYYTLQNSPGIDNTFSVIHLNARSIKNKFDEIKNIVLNSNSEWDVVCISETWLKDDIIEFYNINGYNMYATFRKRTEGGGTLIYVRNKYEVKERKDLECPQLETNYVQIQLELLSGHKSIIVGEIYRPPNYPNAQFLEYLEQTLEVIENENKLMILAGDFNYNMLKGCESNSAHTFTNLLSSYGFSPIITLPTRVQNEHESLLDNIFINDSNYCENAGVIVDDISDHFPVFSTFYFKHQCRETKKVVKTFDKRKLPELKDFLVHKLRDFSNHDDANAACNDLINAYIEGVETFSKSYRKSRRKTPFNPWITPAILCSINTKNKLYRKFMMNKNVRNETRYKKYRNLLVGVIRDAKTIYFKDSIEKNKNNGKMTWQLLNTAINKQKNKTTIFPSSLYDTTGKIYKQTEIPNGFNRFFTSIAIDLEKDIPVSDVDPVKYLPESEYESFGEHLTTTSKEVSSAIKSLNQVGGGFDGISTNLLLETYKDILNHLTHLFNLCLKQGIFPEKLKHAIITPIYKTGGKDKFNNYRPISLLPVFSKVLEKIIQSSILSSLEQHNILHPLQFGFRKMHSTYMPLAHMYDEISKYCHKGEVICTIYLDLKKAFDTVSIDILLRKLKFIGIEGNLYNIIKSYLSNRTQTTRINGNDSCTEYVRMGVPQGSILGPLLFLIYINDLVYSSVHATFYLFADDTAVTVRANNIGELQEKVTLLSADITQWFQANRLSLNAKKTNYQLYSRYPTSDLDIKLNGFQIFRKRCIKYLGILVDEDLKWKSHINNLSSLLSRNIGIMGRVKHFLQSKQLIMLYNTLVLPYLNYCAVIWGSNYYSNIKKLVMLQKRAVRIIGKKTYFHPSAPLFIEYKILRVPDIVKEQSIMILLAYINNELPSPISEMFNLDRTRHSRHAKHFDIPYAATNYILFSLPCSLPKIWNMIVGKMYKEIGDVPKNKQMLKKEVRKYLIQTYSEQTH